MSIEMSASMFNTSSSGLPMYRVQFLNTETGEVLSDVDVKTSADCVRYINENPLIKEGLGFKKGAKVDTDLKKIVDELLYPYYPPEFVSIINTSNLPEFDKYIEKDQKIYVEKGTLKPKFDLSVTVIAGSKPLVRCTLVRLQNDIRDNIDTKVLSVLPGEKAILDFSVPAFTNDVEYFFEISDNENVIESIKIDYEFILPIYVGYMEHSSLELNIDELNKSVNDLIKLTDRVEKRITPINTQQKAFFDAVTDGVNLCPFILVPLRWNSLVRIHDINGMDITKFFGHNNGIVLRNGNDQEGYILYVAKNPIDAATKVRYLREITYTFAYDIDWKDLEGKEEQSEIITGFEVLTPSPIDSRFVKESYNDLAYIAKPYVGLIVYVKDIQTYYKYNQYGVWEVTNTSVRLYSGKPSETMGGKMDISIDIATGDIYQKNNSNVWELKGNIKGVTK